MKKIPGRNMNITGKKFLLLIDSEAIGIEAFRLNSQYHWELEEYKKINETLNIRSVNLFLPLKEIYERMKLGN